MSRFTEDGSELNLITRVRRVSKSGFLYESNSKSPRLDKMIAHINVYDHTTKRLEDELTQKRERSPTQKRTNSGYSRPQLGPRASEYQQESNDTPTWVTELTSRPVRDQCIVVTEIEQVEDIDNDEEDWGSQV